MIISLVYFWGAISSSLYVLLVELTEEVLLRGS